MDTILQDLRYAFRLLSKTPAVTATVVAAIGLAIGANTLIFSGVHALLLKPLPYPDEDRLFMLFGKIPGESGIAFSTRELELWRSAQQTF